MFLFIYGRKSAKKDWKIFIHLVASDGTEGNVIVIWHGKYIDWRGTDSEGIGTELETEDIDWVVDTRPPHTTTAHQLLRSVLLSIAVIVASSIQYMPLLSL